MKTKDIIEILKVYAGVRGMDKLYAMLTGQLTIQSYLEGVIEGTEKNLSEKRKKLGEAVDKSFMQKMLSYEIADLERTRAFAQGYLAVTKKRGK